MSLTNTKISTIITAKPSLSTTSTLIVGFWIVLVSFWCYYYRRVFYALGKEWMDPTVVGWRRLPMHVPLRLFEDESLARRAACRPEMLCANSSNNDKGKIESTADKNNNSSNSDIQVLTPNVWNLDGTWQFNLYHTVEEGINAVTQNSVLKDKITVPSNWTLGNFFDKPIYTNIKYPIPCRPPIVPHQNPTGVYRLDFDLPWENTKSSAGTIYTLMFHGVESASYVYLNNAMVGFSKDSRLPFEIDVTHAIKDTNNVLKVVVIRWSDGTYVEDQDHWWMAGIHRSVELIRRKPQADLFDYQVQADANGNLNVWVQLLPREHGQRVVLCKLYSDEQTTAYGDWEPGDCVLDFQKNVEKECSVVLSEHLDNPRLWSAELPNLYTLTISILIEGKIQQVESCRVGFRTVDIKNGMVHVNDKPITICGINRHEHDPDHGKVVSLDRMKQDIVVLKQNNFNAVRTSHYPTHSSFYRLCDYYGLYVCDEANIETHGMFPMGRLAHDWGWHDAFLSRILRTIHRDRNHASIIFWSLGNEAGRGRNLWKARRTVKQLDPSRPVVYESGGAVNEGHGRTELTDVICTMYPSVARTLHLGTRDNEDRPVILCEYSHAMGNSNGNLHMYWNEFWSKDRPRLQGGFIWDMIDQGLRIPDKSSKRGYYFGYGGDFGDTINDLQFCINGLFTPDREPHPAVSEAKYLQQPIKVTIARLDNGSIPEEPYTVYVGDSARAVVELEAVNRYTFRDMTHLSWSWDIVSNRSTESIKHGTLRFIEKDEERKSKASVDISNALKHIVQLEKSRPLSGNKFFLNVTGCLNTTVPWAKTDHVLIFEQFSINFQFENSIERTISMIKPAEQAKLEVSNGKDSITIFRVALRGRVPFLVVDRTSGAVTRYSPFGFNFLCGTGITTNLTRASTDNDNGGLVYSPQRSPSSLYEFFHRKFRPGNIHSFASMWQFFGLNQSEPPIIKCNDMRVSECNGQVEIVALCHVYSERNGLDLFKLAVHYTAFEDGRVRIEQHLVPQPLLRIMPSLPRIGISLVLDKEFYHVSYFGRGPGENYPDRKEGSKFGCYATTAAEMGYDKYVVPGENGSRDDCEWVSFKSSKGEGICCILEDEDGSASKFSCSALLYSASELQNNFHMLPERQNGTQDVHVNIDYKLMGLGGDNSWEPTCYAEFWVPVKTFYQYSVWLLPMRRNSEPAIVASQFRAPSQTAQ